VAFLSISMSTSRGGPRLLPLVESDGFAAQRFRALGDLVFQRAPEPPCEAS
jgi:hypothetical protein